MSPNQAPPKGIKVLVVDDEPLARKRLVDLLRDDSDVVEIREAENGLTAASAVQERCPDIVFLDVQMPGVDGFGVINALGDTDIPLTIFVTAHDQYAVQAFEADAVDYLLKPFSDKRFATALSRAKSSLGSGEAGKLGPNVRHLAARRDEPGKIWDWLVVKSTGCTEFVMVTEIDWIQAAGVYVNLHVQGKELIYRSAVGELAERLDPSRFVRIHRSTIVNIRSIKRLEPISHGDFEVTLKDGTQLNMSRNYRGELERRLGQSL